MVVVVVVLMLMLADGSATMQAPPLIQLANLVAKPGAVLAVLLVVPLVAHLVAPRAEAPAGTRMSQK